MKFAASRGLTDAQMKLGNLYNDNGSGLYDLPESIQYFTMAADSGSSNAQYTLATAYLDGNGTEQDYIKAYNWFKQASSEEYSESSGVFQTPISISKLITNCSNVMYMFIEVTERGVDSLDYNIGSLYESGVQRDGEYIFNMDYASAAKYYLAASDKGDSRADYRLGIMHEYGKHFGTNIATAVTYYDKASIQGNTDATYRLACLYANGYGVTQDLLKAFQLYTEAYSKGHKDANKELKIERAYTEGELGHSSLLNEDPKIPVNRKTRIHMLEKATENGYIMQQYQVGVGYEGEKDYQKAFKWLSLAANIGVTDAYYRLGVFYEEGRFIEQDYTMAAMMYQKAIESEHEGAYYRIGRLHQYGKGVEFDYLKAYQYYKKAEKMDHEEAHKVLNITLGGSKFNFPSSQEFYDSFLMCKHLATHGDIELQFKVRLVCEYNYSKPNYKEAFNWYSMAANNLHTEAMYRLGFLYEKGLGVSPDYQKANQFYKQANQEKNDGALYRLAIAYHHGQGVEIDVKMAIECYERAAELGNPEY